MIRQESYECGLNLKATELRLALPGSDEQEQPSTSLTCIASKKRSSRDDTISPPTKAQIVGWPPVQSYRKNNVSTKKVDGSRLYVKVNMDGAPYLRKIDLKTCKGYGELLEMLENMFKVRIGRYSDKEGYGESDNLPSYEDKEGDWMLVGDVPWEMFVSSCKRLRIIKSYEAKVASLRTSWTQSNPGRRFLGCNRYMNGDGCDFFQWVDRPIPHKIVGYLHKEEPDYEQRNVEPKMKKLSWIQLMFVLIVGIVIGRLSVSGCNAMEWKLNAM